MTVDVTPAEVNRPWRLLDRGVLSVDVLATDATGHINRVKCRITPEPFVPSGATVPLLVGYIDGLTEPVERIRLKADWLDGAEYAWSALANR